MDHFKGAELSQATKKQYNMYIEKWLHLGYKSMKDLLRSPKEAMQQLENSLSSATPTLKHNYLSAVVAYITHCVPRDHRAQFARTWTKLQKENYRPIQERYDNQEAGPRQISAAVKWDQVLEARAAHPESLLLAFYTYLPPVRADYNAVHLAKKPEGENYIVMGKEYRLVLHEFKTAKTYTTIEHVLPQPLKEILDKSLIEKPRDYLFTYHNGEPMTAKAFSAYANRELTRLIGHKTTLTALRHAYVETIDYNKSYKDLKTIANGMGHSVERSMLYKVKNE